jgi:dTMP kinase
VFVTFEGIDGSGKSTQVELLRQELERRDRTVVATREPGGTAIGEGIRDLVLHGVDMTAWTEALLYAAARAELVGEVIRPAVERGDDVVCDRYLDSSVAYQGCGRGLGFDTVLELNLNAVGRLLPDRTFLLAVEPADALRRGSARPDRIERETLDFHRRVDAGYRSIVDRVPDRVALLDASRPPDELAEEVRGHLGLS